MLPLAFANPGEKCKVRKVNGKDELRRHLANLGFVEGEAIEVVSRNGGNLIISVKDSRIAVSREMAQRIVVDENQ